MGLQLKQIEDARDPLMRLSRKECEHVARYMNVTTIEPGMPKPLMIRRLKEAGVMNFKSVTDRGLGALPLPTPRYEEWVAQIEGKSVSRQQTVPAETQEIRAEDHLEREWAVRRERQLEDLRVPELRAIAKQRGHSLPRTIKKVELLEILNGEDAA